MAEKLAPAEEYRERARALREQALTANEHVRNVFLQIAVDYDLLAGSVDALEKSKKSLSRISPKN